MEEQKTKLLSVANRYAQVHLNLVYLCGQYLNMRALNFTLNSYALEL